MSRPESLHQRPRIVLFGPHFHPSETMIRILRILEMGVIGRARVDAPATRNEHVQDVAAVSHFVRQRGCPVVNLESVGRVDALDVFYRQAVIGRVGHDHECAARRRSRRQLGPGLTRLGRGKVEREAGRDDVPQVSDLSARGVQFGSYQGCEAAASKRYGVRDRMAVPRHEMVGQGDEVVPVVAVPGDRLGRVDVAIGTRRMGVEVAAPESAGFREGQSVHGAPLVSSIVAGTDQTPGGVVGVAGVVGV